MEEIKKFPRIGVGVIVLSNGKVLLGKRKGSHGVGTWAFPGGHLEYGESVEACAARELEEETGLKAHVIIRGQWTNDIIDLKHYITLFMLVESYSGNLELKEPEKCSEWGWFAWDALPNPLFPSVASLISLFPERKFLCQG